MKSDIDIKQLLSAVDVPAQWVGLREVYEAHTPRMIRDGVPVANGRAFTHGIMVEVLVNGHRANKQLSLFDLEAACGCDNPMLVQESGCETCKTCGWSACKIS